eukprot:239963_1
MAQTDPLFGSTTDKPKNNPVANLETDSDTDTDTESSSISYGQLKPVLDSETKSKEISILNEDNKNSEFNVTTNSVLPINKSYIFKNIKILNSKLSLKNHGTLNLESLNNITIENSVIDFAGNKKKNSPHMVKTAKKDCKYYGKNFKEIYIGTDGRGMEGRGGGGGSGIRLKCRNKLLLINSVININGTACCPGKRQSLRCGSPGGNGSCLIICDDIELDETSKIQKGRVVIKSNKLLTNDSTNYLVYGYLRTLMTNNFIYDICNICHLYVGSKDLLTGLYNKIKDVIFVDNEWNAYSKSVIVKSGIIALKTGIKIQFITKNTSMEKEIEYNINFNKYSLMEFNEKCVAAEVIKKLKEHKGIKKHYANDWKLKVMIWENPRKNGWCRSACWNMDIWNKIKIKDLQKSHEGIVLLYESNKTIEELIAKSGSITGLFNHD